MSDNSDRNMHYIKHEREIPNCYGQKPGRFLEPSLEGLGDEGMSI